jgi:protein TorT
VSAEVAVSLRRALGLSERIKVLADYITRGIKRGRILAAPTDFPVLQGRLGVEMAVRQLEGKLEVKHAGPAIKLIDEENVDVVGSHESLAPASFKPTFTVE